MTKKYPFSMRKNQHNFFLIMNVTWNEMNDMDMGEIEYNEKRYEYLEKLHDEAERFYDMGYAPVVYLEGKDYGRAKELSIMAQNHRYEANLKAGNTKWLAYC